MKKIILFSAFIFSFSFADGLSGVTYFEFSEDAFSIKRTYFTYKSTISEQLSYKFQTDVGPVGDDRLTAYLKKAQLDWELSNNMGLSIGLIGLNMFSIQENTWGNRFIAKSAMDANGWSSSADLGFSLTNDFGMITANLMVTNGEGYKNTSNLDNNSKISLQLLYGEKRLDKNNGYNVGLVHSNVKSDGMANVPGINVWNLCDADAEIAGYCVVADDDGYWTIEGDSDEIPEAVTTVLGLFGGWSNTNIVVGAEYNTMDVSFSNLDEDVPSDLTSIYANYIVRNNLTVFVRRDHFDPNDDIQHGDSVDTTIAGFIWAPTKGLAICPNITQVTQVGYEEDVFAVNFQFKF